MLPEHSYSLSAGSFDAIVVLAVLQHPGLTGYRELAKLWNKMESY